MNRQIPLYDWRVIWGRWSASNLVARGGLREAARILEVHHLVVHCICDGVDAQLLGLPDVLTHEQENSP